MARRRFFVPEVRNGQAELEGEEARHLTQVLRVETGQLYEISDNSSVYLAEVELARKQHVVFRITEKLPEQLQSAPATLLLALIKFDRLETAIEKATELGVGTIQLVIAERSEKGLELAAVKRLARWERIVLEAAQQSRRTRLPGLLPPVALRTALQRASTYRFFLDEQRTGGNLLDLAVAPGTASLLVGPEGGWAGHERESALAAGWTPVSLGPLVLRTETAVIAGLAVLNAALDRRS